jgi:hypothetical protein
VGQEYISFECQFVCKTVSIIIIEIVIIVITLTVSLLGLYLEQLLCIRHRSC